VSDLTKRWAVAAAGIPVVVGLLYLGGWPLALPLAALAALGSMEVHRMAVLGGVPSIGGFGSAGATALVLAAAWQPTFRDFAPLATALLGLLVGTLLVVAIVARGPEDRPLSAVAVTLFGSVYVGLPMAFVPLLHALPEAHGWTNGPAWAGGLVVALPLAATWLGDATALYVGTAWGRGGLAPAISPNKSWAGVWGGLAGAGLGATLWFLVADARLPGLPVPGVVVAGALGVILGAGAIVGDLAESLVKREAGVKDSGAVFPGHGGVLDRLDALIFTLPTSYVALVLLESVS
jgi:phosphatidate cytidylyltransferase